MENKTVITTSESARTDIVAAAEELATQLELKYVPRARFSLAEIRRITGAEDLLVVAADRISLKTAHGDFFFHPNMAKVRIRSIDAGVTDMLAAATGVKPGDAVLDCTLGFAADAIILSYLVGTGGRIVGLESVPIIAELTRRGLQQYKWDDSRVEAALRRIEVITADHADHLRHLPDRCFDIVYFDPMFRRPLYKADGMQPLREIANAAPLNLAVITEAKRVARRRVVLKERNGSAEFARLGFKNIIDSKSSYLAFGYIALEGNH